MKKLNWACISRWSNKASCKASMVMSTLCSAPFCTSSLGVVLVVFFSLHFHVLLKGLYFCGFTLRQKWIDTNFLADPFLNQMVIEFTVKVGQQMMLFTFFVMQICTDSCSFSEICNENGKHSSMWKAYSSCSEHISLVWYLYLTCVAVGSNSIYSLMLLLCFLSSIILI